VLKVWHQYVSEFAIWTTAVLTSDAARLAGILAAGRVDIAGEHLSVQHEVGLEGDLENDKLE